MHCGSGSLKEVNHHQQLSGWRPNAKYAAVRPDDPGQVPLRCSQRARANSRISSDVGCSILGFFTEVFAEVFSGLSTTSSLRDLYWRTNTARDRFALTPSRSAEPLAGYVGFLSSYVPLRMEHRLGHSQLG